MLNRVFIFLLAIAIYTPVRAQHDPYNKDTSAQLHDKSHLRISILTGSPGEDPFETFGHTSIRIIDSTKSGGERDVIYNYGFFEVFEGRSILSQFLTGRVRVLLDTITYDELITEYVVKKRGLVEQLLLLDGRQKESVLSFLKNNMSDRYYYYDASYDNCTTRTRDLFPKVFGKSFVYGQTIPQNSRLTFREVSLYRYCPPQHKYWYGLGLNIFYGIRTDKVMSNTDAMFLASYLSDGLKDATINGQKICGDKVTILEDKVPWPSKPNVPFIILLIISLVTIFSLLFTRLRILGNVMSSFLLVSTGLLGCFIVYLWFMNREPGWKDNFNILWALPTNLIIPFFGPKIKAKYGLAAICLLGATLVVHILKIQVLPLFEIGSILVALLFIYCIMYKKDKTKPPSV